MDQLEGLLAKNLSSGVIVLRKEEILTGKIILAAMLRRLVTIKNHAVVLLRST
jgi:hypothetical protein